MPITFPSRASPRCAAVLLFMAGSSSVLFASPVEEPWKDLQEQNHLLRAQLQTQQHQIDELRAQMDKIAGHRESVDSGPSIDRAAPSSGDGSERKLVVTGEVGLAFLAASRDGQYRNNEFRVDDAALRFEATVAHDTYFFGELQLSRREALEDSFYLGEFYLEFENLSGRLGGPDRLVNVRFGRVNIPFGEEYQHRTPLANPLVTHSLTDFWGIDEGVEVFGELGHASYALAMQNGSSETQRDYNADKALTLRLGYDFTTKFHLSASALRTGKLASANENSEVWMGNNVFRNIGSAQSTTHQAELAELDAAYTWNNGHLGVAGGIAHYRDNDPRANNTRHFSFYQIEGVQSWTHEVYSAFRFSTLQVNRGYPLAGIGNFGKYFRGALQTKDLQRFTLGGGYRFNRSLVLKFDYTLEEGELTTGAGRDNHLVSFESALGF